MEPPRWGAADHGTPFFMEAKKNAGSIFRRPRRPPDLEGAGSRAQYGFWPFGEGFAAPRSRGSGFGEAVGGNYVQAGWIHRKVALTGSTAVSDLLVDGGEET